MPSRMVATPGRLRFKRYVFSPRAKPYDSLASDPTCFVPFLVRRMGDQIDIPNCRACDLQRTTDAHNYIIALQESLRIITYLICGYFSKIYDASNERLGISANNFALANRRHRRCNARKHQQGVSERRASGFSSRQNRQSGCVSSRLQKGCEPSSKADVVEGYEDASLHNSWHHHSPPCYYCSSW